MCWGLHGPCPIRHGVAYVNNLSLSSRQESISDRANITHASPRKHGPSLNRLAQHDTTLLHVSAHPVLSFPASTWQNLPLRHYDIATMRLINCTTLEFEEFIGKNIQPYAILSHTWETHEISFKDYCHVDGLRLKPGSAKILKTCEIALQMGHNYTWIDTCSIDKSSSAGLTEAINSMFKWYRQSARCIVYLSDFDSTDPSAKLSSCRWFTRGWTLQELIAPRDAWFFDAQWRYYGTKQELGSEISRITGVTAAAIKNERLYPHPSVAEIMS